MSKIVMCWGYLGFVFLFLYFSHLSSSFSLAFSNVIYGPANASVSLHAYVQKANREGFFSHHRCALMQSSSIVTACHKMRMTYASAEWRLVDK